MRIHRSITPWDAPPTKKFIRRLNFPADAASDCHAAHLHPSIHEIAWMIHSPATIGYIAVFLLIAAESAGLPVPGETSLTTASVLAAHGHLTFPLVLVIATAAAILGDNLGYAVGRHGGRRLLQRDGIAAAHRRRFLSRSDQFFARHGAVAVFTARWLPILRFTAAPLAGANRMPWRKFLIWNTLGAICWAASIGSLAYFVGSQASEAIPAIGLLGLLMLTLTIISHIAWRFLRRPQLSADSPY